MVTVWGIGGICRDGSIRGMLKYLATDGENADKYCVADDASMSGKAKCLKTPKIRQCRLLTSPTLRGVTKSEAVSSINVMRRYKAAVFSNK